MADFPSNSGRPGASSGPGVSRSPPPPASVSRVDLTLPPLRNLSTSTQASYQAHQHPPSTTHPPIPSRIPQNIPQYPSPYSQTAMGSPLPPHGAPPVQQMPPLYHQGQPMPHQPHHFPLPQDPNGQTLRYPLPAAGPDSRLLTGGRHKKEIKRRTKTGCLTCRKRRIKVRWHTKTRSSSFIRHHDRCKVLDTDCSCLV